MPASPLIPPPLLSQWLELMSDAHLRAQAGDAVFSRGQIYASSSSIQDAPMDVDTTNQTVSLSTVVQGTQPYHVMLVVKANNLLSGCDCPHGSGGNFCKHQVAVAMVLRGKLGGQAPIMDEEAQKKIQAAAKRMQTKLDNANRLQQFLAQQPSAILADKLWEWAEADRYLMRDLKAWQTQLEAKDDPKALKAAIQTLLKNSGNLYDWRNCVQFAHQIQRIPEMLRPLFPHQVELARQLCEYTLERLLRIYENSDDSGGDIGDVIHSLVQVWNDAIRDSAPDSDWLHTWLALRNIDYWHYFDEDELLTHAPHLRDAYDKIVEKEWHAYLKRNPTNPQKAARAGYVEKSRERSQLRQRYLKSLEHHGDTQGLIEAMRTSLQYPHEHVELIQLCESHQRLRDALHYAQVAYKLYPDELRIEDCLLRAYERDGWDQEALALYVKRLHSMPNVENYQKTLDAAKTAGENLETYRQQLYDWLILRETKSLSSATRAGLSPALQGERDITLRISWLLHDHKLNEALTLLQVPEHSCSRHLITTLALQLPASQYAQALALLMPLFESAMSSSQTPYQQELRLVNEICKRLAEPERSQWIQHLKTKYKAKRNFVAGLAQVG